MKKRSVVGIIISVIMSILLVPFLWVFEISGTAMMTVSSVVKEERKEEVLSTFVENKGIDWVYGMIKPMIDEMIAEYAAQYEEFDAEGLLTVEDVERIATEFYGKAVNGEVYETDLTFIADRIKPQLDGIVDKEIDKQIDAQAEEQIASYVDENLETIYDSLSADVKAEIKAEVKLVVLAEVEKEFDAQADAVLEEEVNKYIKENYPGVPESMVKEEKEKYLAENKDRLIAEAKAETLAEAEVQFDAEADTYIRENIREIYAQIDEETKAELIARAKEEALPKFKEEYKAQHKQQYVDEAAAMIDEAVLTAQNEVNTTIAEVYTSEAYVELEQAQKEYNVNIYDFAGISKVFQSAGFLCFGAAAVIALILLACHVFRPSGFFVAGFFTLVLGIGVKAVAGRAVNIAAEMIDRAVEMPHESIGALVQTALTWVEDGLGSAGMISIYAGAVLVLLGVLMLVLKRNKTA